MLSTNINTSNESEHQKIWKLLPWYVNHSLDPNEQDIVKAHLRHCIACRLELNQQQLLLAKMQQADLLQQVSQVSFAQLKKRIENQHPFLSNSQEDKSAQSKNVGKLFAPQFWSAIQFSALAASLVLLALPFLSNSTIEQVNLTGEYRTLANPVHGEQKNNMLRIVFSEHANPKQISAALHSVSGQIIKGPLQNGVYEVQIGNEQTGLQEVKTAISNLRNNKIVVFAELAHGLSTAD
ncbi:MAG: zf-HC2 domain-containing protein [Nitrosomonas sp.]|nr:MAG: zf-HC2 domain-containing protein [Nitrosomonas sp.]